MVRRGKPLVRQCFQCGARTMQGVTNDGTPMETVYQAADVAEAPV